MVDNAQLVALHNDLHQIDEAKLSDMCKELAERYVIVDSVTPHILKPHNICRFDEEVTYEGQPYIERMSDNMIRQRIAKIDAAMASVL